ncbi:RecX family transcriptional regulator [Lichenihabitans sp. Uapishka_5]|uniref:regulatory protein RecX n=1 Tax=Lichenihabitans sp. Uapishka_5 TaxID=3037302 RepID=UPI0029E7F95E|nr:RecX family transcriptional regulator [Lichenihabitans sp. Uapishka_5]MDX7949711.1 RecX family transcriptional regulator [Lichenihabitans sp. Uapishka_5]
MSAEPPAIPDRSALMRMATGYLARYAASSQRLRQVLARRIARWCATRGLEPPEPDAVRTAVEDVVARLQALGLLDDTLLAASRSRALARKGLPASRITMTLRQQGLQIEDDTAEEEPLDDAVQARRFAERKRLGPFRLGDRAVARDKDLRRLIRAGFSFSTAVAVVDAETQDEEGR